MKNSQKWNRILTGAAAVSLAIGTMAPMAFAASASTQYNTRTMNVGSGFTAVVSGLVAQDQGHATEFLPIYYLMQGLGKLGYTVNWNGGTRVLNITTPTGVTVSAPSAAVGTPGADQMVIQLNGTGVMLAPRVVAKDPASGVVTTFAPIYYLNQALKSAGFTNTYNGSSWTLSGQAASQTGTLGAITTSNASSGTGTAASPAVSLNGAAISLSTTLKDASGNPLPNTAVTFNMSEYGNLPSQQPTVANASGTLLSPTTTSSADQYTVYTNTSGVASISVTGPAGQTYAYEVTATAPYASATSGSLSTAAAYVDFVAGDTAGIAPYASQSTPFSASMGTAVPITVTLPPNAAGQAQANVLLTLTVDAPASFVSSTGQLMGQQIQVSTNSAGIAQSAITSANVGEVSVNVSASSLPSGVTAPTPTYISFGQSGVAAQVANYNITSTSLQAGQNVTVSGTLEDASGNPVPNGQVLVVGNDLALPVTNTLGSNNNGSFGYVTGTGTSATVTDFPNVGLVSNNMVALASGMSATTSAGDLVTADSNGNFSFVVTDTGDDEASTFSIYGVSNGQVASSAPLKSDTIDFTQGTTLSSIGLGGTDSQASGNTFTSLTGLTATSSYGNVVYMDPQNAAGNPLDNQNLSYNVAVSNGGTVTALQTVEGTTLPINSANPGLAALTITETYNSANALPYTFTVSGQNGSISSSSPDLALTMYNTNTGSTTLTITSGSAKSTATATFSGGAPTYVQSFTPVTTALTAGQSATVTFTVEDANGNPVTGNSQVAISSQDAASPLWITEVNGVTLAQSENMGSTISASYTSEPTPIPLGVLGTAYTTSLGYTSVVQTGVVSWTGGNVLATTNSSGQVTLTLQAGDVNYYVAAGTNTDGSITSSPSTLPGSNDYFYTYYNKSDSATNPFGSALTVATNPTNTMTTDLMTQQLGVIAYNQTINTTTGLPSSYTAGSFTYSGTAPDNVATNLTVSGNTSTGGTYSITGYEAPGASSYSSTIPSGLTFNSSTGAVTVNNGAKTGSYKVTYSLNGAPTGTGTFNVILPTPAVVNSANSTSTLTVSSASVSNGTPFAVQGTIYDAAGNPIPNATISVTFAGASSPASATTGSAGQFTAIVTPTTVTSSVPTYVYVTPSGGTQATLTGPSVTVN